MRILSHHYESEDFFQKEMSYFQRNWVLVAHAREFDKTDTLFKVGPGYICKITKENQNMMAKAFFVARPDLVSDFPSLPFDIPLTVALFEGLLFVRLGDSGANPVSIPLVFKEEFERHQTARNNRFEHGFDLIPANWKSIVEISLEETHVESVHPQMHGIFKGSQDYKMSHGVRRWHQRLVSRGFKNLSVLIYLAALRVLGIPKSAQAWVYYWIFPGTEIELYPEKQGVFYQVIPIHPKLTLKRWTRFYSSTSYPFKALATFLNRKIQMQIDAQDIEYVSKSRPASITFEKSPTIYQEDERLVQKFHELILSETE